MRVSTSNQRPSARRSSESPHRNWLTGPPDSPDADEYFESERRRLFGIAYRVLRHRSDAEEVVQEVWLRWHATDRTQVRDRGAFLHTITTRLALNVATSAHARREISVGEPLAEPVTGTLDLAERVVRDEAVEGAIHLLLERLPPAERAVYVLREAFDYSYRDVARVLTIREDYARQLVRRARLHVSEQRRQPVDRAERDALLCAFVDAARVGAMTRLLTLLTGTGGRSCARRRDLGASVVA